VGLFAWRIVDDDVEFVRYENEGEESGRTLD
jgi:hypothetical protein